ncbi:MAG: hypothetical protein PQJ58_06130 [Spirochaetales bacterium]|nr:hypothetical protein [Spirochaetales bacterium]
MKRHRLTALFLILLPLTGLQAQTDSLISEAALVHYSGQTGRAGELIRTLETASSSAEGKELTELFLYRGLLHIDLKENEKASSVLAEGIEYCSLQYEEGGDLFYLVQGALLKSHWMLLQKTGVLIRTGGEIQEMTDLALRREPDNFTARLLSAQGLINAPPLFGGDPEQAAELLLDSENLAVSDAHRFDLYLTLADARRKKKVWDEASLWCEEALNLFPDNPSALEMKELIRKKKK